MRLIDSHTHIDDKSYDKDRNRVLERAARAGVAACLVVGITEKSCHKAVKVSQDHKGCFATVGVHPHDTQSITDTTIGALKNLAGEPVVRAWGETGLDYVRMFSPQDVQEKWFAAQLEAAADLDLPLVLHERGTRGRMLAMLKDFGRFPKGGVVHCFSGNTSDLKGYLDLGFHIGITGIVTQKDRGADLRAMLPSIPMGRLLVETDCPYLVPAPYKKEHRRNEPAFVTAVAETVARVLGRSQNEVAEATFANTLALFSIREDEIPS